MIPCVVGHCFEPHRVLYKTQDAGSNKILDKVLHCIYNALCAHLWAIILMHNSRRVATAKHTLYKEEY